MLEFLLQADLGTVPDHLEADVNRPQGQRDPAAIIQQGGKPVRQGTLGAGNRRFSGFHS
jgi:hypothetical protein